ncbi:MAG: type I glyceraldehyde-3-phosphate dehydrogenase [Candidatus Latescibacteria bacterium]|nr:type I glyceraldehyde-3-phosphate dehydrogenase [Candidatus Latescibacterota bacterium]
MARRRINLGINGYGRIGRAVHRLAIGNPMIRVAAINSRSDSETMTHLLKYDSVYGRLESNVAISASGFVVDGDEIAVYREETPDSIPWADHDIDVVIESTGKFKDLQSTAGHLRGGKRHVVLCCPPKSDAIPAVVMGVNQDDVDLERTPVISNASCTTNALAPLLGVLDQAFGIDFCSFRTIHAITDSQHLLDNSDSDLRRARGAVESIIPTSTGASAMIARLFPHLDGRVNGLAYRVPTRTVSNIDLCVKVHSDVSAEDVNSRFVEAARNEMHGIIGVTDEPLVSVDFSGDPSSVTLDLSLTTGCGDGLFNLAGWYDNEWGYSARVLDLATHIAGSSVLEYSQSDLLSLTA